MIPPRTTLALLLLVATMLLAAGCTGQPANEKIYTTCQDNSIKTVTTTTQTIQESLPLYKVTISQMNVSYPDFIKTDQDSYNVGEIIEFYMINEGSDSITCANWQPSYRIYYFFGNGSRQGVGSSGIVQPAVSCMNPGSRTPIYRHDTSNWVPGRYIIQFDCGGVGREILIREVPRVTAS